MLNFDDKVTIVIGGGAGNLDNIFGPPQADFFLLIYLANIF